MADPKRGYLDELFGLLAVVDALQPKVQALNAQLPLGYTIVPGGTVEESAKATSSVAAAVPAALLIMLVVLMIQLQSFNRLLLVLSVAPFGIIGVVAALLISGKPLGFVAILGVLALVGIRRLTLLEATEIDVERRTGRQRRITEMHGEVAAKAAIGEPHL